MGTDPFESLGRGQEQTVRVYVSIDMEGVAGVVHPEQVRRGGPDYETARRWMTGEANAAIDGAMSAGATAVLVNDAHGDMRNILLDEIDRRATVIAGSLKPGAMVAGVEGGFDAAFFLGYHAGAGTLAGVLDHTYFGRVVAEIRVNEEPFDEAAINAAVAGEAGVPVALVTGDATVCAHSKRLLGDIETVAVKEALTRYAAITMPPAEALPRIHAAATRAVAKVRGGLIEPFRPRAPLELEVEFVNTGCADAAEQLPGSERTAGRCVAYSAPDAGTLLRAVRVMTTLAAASLA